MSKIQSLPPTHGIKDAETRMFCDAVTNLWLLRNGQIGYNDGQRFITKEEWDALAKNPNIKAIAGIGVVGGPGGGPGTPGAPGIPGIPGDNGLPPWTDVPGMNPAMEWLLQLLAEPIKRIELNDILRVNNELWTQVYQLKNGLTHTTELIESDTFVQATDFWALHAQVNDPITGLPVATADIYQINKVEATSTSANARHAFYLDAQVNDGQTGLAKAHAFITDINFVDVNSNSANARRLSSTTALVGFKNKVFVQTARPVSTADYTLLVNDVWLDASNGNKMHRWNGSDWEDASDMRIATSGAGVTQETIARAEADNVVASQVNNIWGYIGVTGQEAIIQQGNKIIVNPAISSAVNWTQLQTETGELRQESIIHENRLGVVEAAWTLKITTQASDGIKTIHGFGLAVTGEVSAFVVEASTFAIYAPAKWPPQDRLVPPFSVLAETDANGNPPGAYIYDAFIKNAAIGTLKVQGETVTTMAFGEGGFGTVGSGSGSGYMTSATLYLPALATGTACTGTVNLAANGNPGSTVTLGIVRTYPDGKRLHTAGLSIVNGFYLSYTVSAIDDDPAEGYNTYGLAFWVDTGPAVSWSGASIAATGGRR